MSNIIAATFEGTSVRVKTDDLGNPWFVAKDVCGVLGISKYRDAVARLDEDESMPLRVDASGIQVSCISESGLYSVILRSQKPEAKRFKKWVTSEVLPSIRKTGSYSAPNQPLPSIPSQLLATAQCLVDHDRKIQEIKVELSDSTLTSSQISEIDALITDRYRALNLPPKACGLMKRRLKAEFFEQAATRTYKEIPRSGFSRAKEIIQSWFPPEYTGMRVV